MSDLRSIELVSGTEMMRRETERVRERSRILARNEGQITLDELRIVEPGLVCLENIAARLHETVPESEHEYAWYGFGHHAGLKPMVMCLFGWCREAGPRILQTNSAYNLAYDSVLDVLENGPLSERG